MKTDERKELINALTVIQNVCRKHQTCNTCPLRRDFESSSESNDTASGVVCMVSRMGFTPLEWSFAGIDDWRAFE